MATDSEWRPGMDIMHGVVIDAQAIAHEAYVVLTTVDRDGGWEVSGFRKAEHGGSFEITASGVTVTFTADQQGVHRKPPAPPVRL